MKSARYPEFRRLLHEACERAGIDSFVSFRDALTKAGISRDKEQSMRNWYKGLWCPKQEDDIRKIFIAVDADNTQEQLRIVMATFTKKAA